MKTYRVTVDTDGTIRWYYELGQLHREDGPAVEWADGTKVWCRNGKLHREDGPACEWAEGSREWFIDGKKLTEAQFKARTQSCEGRIVEIEGKKYKLQAV
jgi:hypothetical protein